VLQQQQRRCSQGQLWHSLLPSLLS
jgi:hypothetical protein